MAITEQATLADRYRVVARLGAGGMAEVFEAEDLLLERRVAVKVLRGASSQDARRFAAEIRAQSPLTHPSIVRLYDAGTHDGSSYLVMELVGGRSLADLLADGPLDPGLAAALGRQLAGALDHAHRFGVVHRDVKPSNVLIDEDGTARLADFGIARLVDEATLTATGTTIGTAAYLAPEQLRHAPVAGVADVYALGLVLLEALTGHRAFPGSSVEAAMARLVRDPAVPDHLPAAWRALLAAMTARDPGARPDARAVAARLQALEVDAADAVTPAPTLALSSAATVEVDDPAGPGGQELARDEPTVRTSRAGLRPRRASPLRAWMAVAAVAGLLAAGLLLGLVGSDRPAGPPRPAVTAEQPAGAERMPPGLDDALRRLEEAVRP
ncbi:MAG TPA: serine/threonine-protein kinase [Egibacteraceae bacterium]|nr:serine/threonine-protein kinase [Egibacteraceae bacterium]